jgi:metal-responsive CopG/Arc/MetJ family transcriptional regulator
MGKAKVKLDKNLFEKVKKYAEISGYTSAEEFISHCLEKEITQLDGSYSEEEVKKKLKGLGYIS